ncbi:MAG: XrtA/PEP-CTERM system exopolysaccharide export protein [Woeseiaceae bacterium]
MSSSTGKWWVLLAGLAAGCASGGKPLPAAECVEPEINSLGYLIGPGDTLEINVWRNEGLSVTLPVRPDGRISTPLVEDMQASGKSPTELAGDIETVLSQYVRTPEVSVIVTEQGSANQIQIVGQVLTAQPQSYRENIRVLDVIVAVGGLTEFAAGNRTEVVRQTGPGQVKCRIRLDDLLDGDTSQNIKLFPGDILLVPETRF